MIIKTVKYRYFFRKDSEKFHLGKTITSDTGTREFPNANRF